MPKLDGARFGWTGSLFSSCLKIIRTRLSRALHGECERSKRLLYCGHIVGMRLGKLPAFDGI